MAKTKTTHVFKGFVSLYAIFVGFLYPAPINMLAFLINLIVLGRVDYR